MDEKNIEFEVVSERKLKWLKFKARCREKFHAGVEWCKENKEILILAGTGVAGAVKLANKASTTRRTEEKRVEYYDPHTGAHWQLKRRLTNDERAELMRRQRAGEFTEDILEDMGVLK